MNFPNESKISPVSSQLLDTTSLAEAHRQLQRAYATLVGTESYWDDLRVDANVAKAPASGNPSFDAYKTTLSLYAFSKTATNSLHFNVQMPHSWREGTNIYPHVHWVPKTSDAGAPPTKTACMWALEYTWANIGGVFGSSATMYNNVTTLDEAHVADKHYITILKDGSGNAYISGTGKTASSMLVCRVYRDGGGSLGTDSYDDVAYLLEIDFHYEVDGFGSNDEYAKSW